MNTLIDFPEEQVLNGTTMPKTIEPVIHLDATLTIQNIAQLHATLKQAYSANTVIEVNASHVSSIDTATLQLLVALKKDTTKQQKTLVFAAPSLRFIESAQLLGLLDILDIKT